MADRIKGQEVSLAILLDGTLQTEIDTIKSAEIEFELELMEEGYLGETSDRVDSIFKLMRVNLEADISTDTYFDLANAIVLRAQNRAGAATRIDLAGTFAFPNGALKTIIIPDVYFDPIPINIGARNEFIGFTLSGKARGFKLV